VIRSQKGFTLIEVLLTVVVLSVGVVGVTKAFNVGLFSTVDTRKTETALNIARARMEEVKNTPFASIVDSGPTADPDFPAFSVEVDESGGNPMQVEITVTWQDREGEEFEVILTTLIADLQSA